MKDVRKDQPAKDPSQNRGSGKSDTSRLDKTGKNQSSEKDQKGSVQQKNSRMDPSPGNGPDRKTEIGDNPDETRKKTPHI